MAEDIYMNYLKTYYEEHGTIADIMPRHIVELDGRTVDIYEFLKKIKYNHKKYVSGKTDRGAASALSLSRYKQLDEMGYDWSVHPPRYNNDPYTDKEILYLRQHYQEHKTINDIGIHDIVEFEGDKIKIGQFLTAMRARHSYFVRGNSKNQSSTNLSKTRYQILEEMNIDWTPQWSNTYDVLNNAICLEYLMHHFQEHGTISDIFIDDVVTYKDQELKIGYFISKSRSRHKDYLEGKGTYDCCSEIFLKRYEILDKLGIIWRPQKEKIENDIYIEYLKEHYKKHGTINDIISSQEVEYNGQKLRIGSFLARMRANYNQHLINPQDKSLSTELSLQRYSQLSKLGFEWTLATRNGIAEFARKNDFSIKQLSKFTSMFKGNAQKSFKIRLLQEKLHQNKPENRYRSHPVSEILKAFNINLDQFIKLLNRDNIHTANKNSTIAYSPNMILDEFCTKNGYRYNVLAIAVCLKLDNLCDESLNSLLNRSLIDYKTGKHTKPSTWIYSKYGNDKLLKQKINATGVASSDILLEMTKECISLEKAFANVIFRKNRKPVPYTKGIFLELVSYYENTNKNGKSKEAVRKAIKRKLASLTKKYDLTETELNTINKSFTEYQTAIHQYRIFDVAFENDRIKRNEKILAYNLDSSDIEDAILAPLQFDGRKLIGRSHELYNRRQLLISLGTTWGRTELQAKKQLVQEHKLKRREVELLENTSREIRLAKELIKKR